MDKFIDQNRRLLILIVSWIIGIGLLLNFAGILICDKLEHANGFQFIVILFGITLLFFPFFDSIKISTSGIELTIKIDNAVTYVANRIEVLKAQIGNSKNATIEKLDQKTETEFLKGNDAKWKIVRLRLEIEQAFNTILNKKLNTIKNTKIIETENYGFKQLFKIYLKENQESKDMEESFVVFNKITDDLLNGQKLKDDQINKGVRLGTNLLRYLKIKSIFGNDINV